MADWRSEANRAIQLALAPSTKRSYDRVVRSFESFRREVGLATSWPIPVEQLMQFCVYQQGKGLAVKSIRGQLTALAFYSKARGVTESTGDFRIRKMLEGWSREAVRQPDGRQPISPGVLKGLVGVWREICKSDFEAALFHSAALVAFFGALRISELIARSKSDSTRKALQRGDVAFTEGTVSIRIRGSKTDQKQKGATIQLGRCSDSELCPVTALGRYLELRGTEPGFLFCHEDGSPLTKYQFWAVTGQALARLGLQGVKFGTHSFRIGAASTAAAMGYPITAIQKVGRWRSAAYRSYVRPLLENNTVGTSTDVQTDSVLP